MAFSFSPSSSRPARRRPWGSAAALAALAATWIVPAARGVDSPTVVVQQTAQAVERVLADKTLSSEQKRNQVEDIARARFDFDILSRLVLARHWKELSSEQQSQFVEEFKRHLSVTYGKNVESYNNEHVEVTGERAESGGDSTVKTRIVRPNAPEILVDYRLRQLKEEWRIIDVIIEGVSLVANFRAQFQEIITSKGAPKLIELLREKNDKGESLKS